MWRLGLLLAAAGAAVKVVSEVAPSRGGPCDIYASGNTPCVAAHSMTRALFSRYAGPLFTVRKLQTNATKDIYPISPGGIVDTAAQEAFCGHGPCVVQRIFDQSEFGNHLGIEHGASYLHPPRNAEDIGVDLADNRSKATLRGKPVHSAYFDNGPDLLPQHGYSNRTATGTATGDAPQSIYTVLSGKVFNGGCCFDYGNAEKFTGTVFPGGPGAMEAV